MKLLRTPSAAARWSRTAPRPLVLVPTMGALHAGHLALIKRARKFAKKTGAIAVSIFVNPTQFGPGEDFSRYPRPFTRDLALCREHGVDAVFAPTPEAMYPRDFTSSVDVARLSDVLCGHSRPGHFRGVGTVVTKLFNILKPDAAVFGEKDFQQLALLRRMARDLDFGVKILPCRIVREHDGLALSSRNQYLHADERAQAPILRAALRAAVRASRREPEFLQKLVLQKIAEAPLAKIDYVEVIDAETLQPATRETQKVRIAVAVFFGRTRLIDNMAVH